MVPIVINISIKIPAFGVKKVTLELPEHDEPEKLDLMIKDLQEHTWNVQEAIVNAKISGTTNPHVLQTGADYNNIIHTETPFSDFLTITFPKRCFIVGIKVRFYDHDGRTYTFSCESTDGASWGKIEENKKMKGIGLIKIQRIVKALRFKGCSTSNNWLHFTMFQLF